MHKKRYIYKITCLLDNKSYVGQRTCNKFPDTKYMGSGLLIKRYIRKYGVENFRKDILEDNITLENLDEREKYWIKKSNTLFPEGLNISTGGEVRCDLRYHPHRVSIINKIKASVRRTAYKHSPEICATISTKLLGKKKAPFSEIHKHNIKLARAKQGATNKNRVFSKEWRANLSKSHIGLESGAKGKKWSEESKDKLRIELTCPYCGKVGKAGGMYAHHFNNCKSKKI